MVDETVSFCGMHEADDILRVGEGMPRLDISYSPFEIITSRSSPQKLKASWV